MLTALKNLKKNLEGEHTCRHALAVLRGRIDARLQHLVHIPACKKRYLWHVLVVYKVE